MRIVILGLSITSSWGNGHATTYRALVRQLGARGHEVTFLERDLPWYAGNRDMPKPAGARTHIYSTLDELQTTYFALVRDIDHVSQAGWQTGSFQDTALLSWPMEIIILTCFLES